MMTPLILALLCSAAPVERETLQFTLYKWQVKKGRERATVETSAGTTTIRTSFAFTDRNAAVPLSATLTLDASGAPMAFRAWGKTSRWTDVDTGVRRDGDGLAIDVDGVVTRAPRPATWFVGVGYAPVALVDYTLRHWDAHGRPATMPVVPIGDVAFEERGLDRVKDDDGQEHALRRVQVRGLQWGRMTVWLDERGRLAALKGNDAEFDQFEAVTRYTEALPALVAVAAQDASSSLTSGAGASTDASYALVGATVVDATGAAPIPDAVVVVRGDRIVDVGPRARVQIPADARVVDVAGKWIVPGLWDMHAHMSQVEWGPIYLAAGATTVRDCGNEPDFIRGFRDGVAAGTGVGPRILLACLVDGPGKYSTGIGVLNDAAAIPSTIAAMKRDGCAQVKIYSGLRPDLVAPLAKAAHAAGMTVTGHVPFGMTPQAALAAGMDMLSHVGGFAPAFFAKADADAEGPARARAITAIDLSSPAARKLIQDLKKRGFVLDPTLTVETDAHTIDEARALEPGIDKVAPALRGPLSSMMGSTTEELARAAPISAKERAIVKALHDAGVSVVAGTDQMVPGHSLHREIELYGEIGFTPLAALQAATIVAARAMKRDGELGTIEKGKIADLVVVDGDPLADLRNLRRVHRTIAAGRIYDPAPLWRLADFTP